MSLGKGKRENTSIRVDVMEPMGERKNIREGTVRRKQVEARGMKLYEE